ncbi:MAG TPA: hypothetical protein VKJ65_03765 [Phycisphaerae bacterium]|nr:hypothetical protein [Phycisphaerae bacterium]
MDEIPSMYNDVPVYADMFEAAKFLGISPRKLWDMGKAGVIRRLQCGRRVLYCLREFVIKNGANYGQHN